MTIVQSLLTNLEQLAASTHAFARRHWQRALQIREKLWFSEEAFHLVLAGGVGVLGGLVNLVFHFCIGVAQRLFFHENGDLSELAPGMTPWQRLFIPSVGGLLAGMVLYW